MTDLLNSLNIFKIKERRAFTLVEVLITLGIIGIVAALTITNLVRNSQNEELVAAFKKTYSELTNAYRQVIYDNGSISVALGPTGGINHSRPIAMLSPYLQTSKVCYAATASAGKCFHTTEIATLDGTGSSWSFASFGGIVLSNGAMLTFFDNNSTCENSKTCGWLLVDTNGFKPPNRYGKDIFRFYYGTNNIYSIRQAGGSAPCQHGNASVDNGLGCADLILSGSLPPNW